jgi:hypothetical protein
VTILSIPGNPIPQRPARHDGHSIKACGPGTAARRPGKPEDIFLMKVICGLAIALFAALVYLLAADIVPPWMALPSVGTLGFTRAFVAFSPSHAASLRV